MSILDDDSLVTKTFPKEHVIFEADSEATEAYLINEGSVMIYKEEDGNKVQIAVLGPGDILGEMALIKKTSHSSSAMATADTTAVVISQEALDEKMNSADPLIKALLHMFIKRIYSGNEKMKAEAQEG